jgi:hypothetical protein
MGSLPRRAGKARRTLEPEEYRKLLAAIEK